FVELFGTTQITDLLGTNASNLMSMSVRGLRDKLIEMRGDVRAQFVSALRAHPQYNQELDHPAGSAVVQPKYTPYRALVDSIVEAANMELHETAQGLAGG